MFAWEAADVMPLQALMSGVNIAFYPLFGTFVMVKNFLGLCLTCFLAGCSLLNSESAPDPFTGGVTVSNSALLEAPLPPGLQTYPHHGFISTSADGLKQGLETLRGYVSLRDTAAALFNTLKTHGWQLRMFSRKGERAIFLYQKGKEYSVLSFRPQGALLILEIWRGQELAEGAVPDFTSRPAPDETGDASIAPEEYGALEPGEKNESREEHWGNNRLEEREL